MVITRQNIVLNTIVLNIIFDLVGHGWCGGHGWVYTALEFIFILSSTISEFYVKGNKKNVKNFKINNLEEFKMIVIEVIIKQTILLLW